MRRHAEARRRQSPIENTNRPPELREAFLTWLTVAPSRTLPRPILGSARRALTPQPESANHLPRLEALRGLAALAVFAYHATVMRVGEPRALVAADPLTRLGTTLNSGVTLFFLLSGFLLFRPFAEALSRGVARPRAGAYAVRRLLRIVPAYWAVLSLYLLVNLHTLTLPGGPLPYYGFAQIYSPAWIAHGIGPAWSLCTELSFYVLVPALAAAIALAPAGLRARRRALGLSLGALAAVSVAIKLDVLLAHGFASPLEHKEWLFWNLDLFALGMAIAVWRDPLAAALARRPRLWRALPAVCGGVVAAALVAAAVVRGHASDPGAREVIVSELYLLAGLGMLVIGLFAPAGSRWDAVLRWRPLLVAGLLSYSLYLLHTAVLERVLGPLHADADWWHGLLAGAVALMLALGAAAACFLLVERPGMLAARRLTRRRHAKGGTARLPGRAEAPTRAL
jgi:peptidoglycan/LPS O-acetylase OafA/YrhL